MSERLSSSGDGNAGAMQGVPPMRQWRLRRKLVIGVTRYLMWGLPIVILLDLIFERNFVQSLGVPALTGMIGLPGSYLVGRSVQTMMRERNVRS